MCRFLAYRGEPIFLEDLVCAPAHSLVHQSLYAEEAKTVTNGDGFGIGWYGERETPATFRDVRPAWSDENLLAICSNVKSGTFFAHIRAATGTATSRANCHPFVHGRFMFMHNGQIGGFNAIRRQVEALIPDPLYAARGGTTDSEAIFLIALGHGLAGDPIGAMARALSDIRRIMARHGIQEALRFSAALTDGEHLYAYRWACDAKPPTLYYREDERGLTIVSEPITHVRQDWREVPKGCTLVAGPGGVRLDCMNSAVERAAA